MTSTTLPNPPNPTPEPTPQAQTPVKVVTRFVVLERIEHIILLISFTTLAVTGLPQKFATAPMSQFIIELFGGIETTRAVHRLSATILMILSVYHLLAILYRVFVQRVPWTMMPVIEDLKHLWHDLLFYFGRRKHKAFYGRYNYAEKMEYLAVVWGTFVMILTGFMMWNPIATTNYLPGEAIPAAKAAHGGEAVLATLAIILWHFYHVHLRHFNKSMFTGKMTRHEMEEEHPAELTLIDTGKGYKPPAPTVLQRRKKVFYPIAVVTAVVSGLLLLGFLTFEKTAIETVPPAITGAAFVPYTPTPTLVPTQTPVPTATPTPNPNQPTTGPVAGEAWDTTISPNLNAKCAACHISASMGDLSLKTYADALKGGKSGAAIVPGDPDASVLVQVQQKGGHAAQLSDAELAQVVTWIEAGAPEQASGGTPPPTTPATTEGWNGGIDQLVNAKCAACHVNASMADLSLKTYADALKGGKSGAAIVPGDPDKSVLVQVQQKGGHAGQFTPEELDRVIAWIKAGAPEQGGAATPPPTEPATTSTAQWSDFEAIFTAKCAACHINASMADLSLKTYADALKGGASGAAIVPGDPAKSVLIQKQQAGGHPGQLTPEEIDALTAWITAGAPEQGGAVTPPPETTAAAPQWSDFEAAFTAQCGACHVSASMGDLSLKTYADALKGGKSGAAIVPGDPDASVLVQVQQKGGHAAELSADELNVLIAWIKAGAPEQGGAATPPATTEQTAALHWSDFEVVFTAQCGACHINASMGDLSLKTYADVLKGGTSGAAIVPGDPEASVLVQVQQKGGHAGMLSAVDLAALIDWIQAGAVETGGAPASGGTSSSGSGDAWVGGIDQLVNAKCAGCHVSASMGNLSLKTYADALKGGQSGAAIMPSDPVKSVLVQVQQKGGHAGQFTPEEIDRIVKWIEAGAPETSSTTGSTPAPTAVEVKTWDDVATIFNAKCTMCHINVQAGNLSLKTYADALKGGLGGPAIVPGDVGKSVLVTKQQGTSHPSLGMLSPEELAGIIAWIEAGAPEK